MLALAPPLLQVTLCSRLQVAQVSPDVPVVVVAIWSLLAGGSEAILLAFTSGVLLDLMGGTPLGSSALALMVVAATGIAVRMGLPRTNPVLQALVVFVGALAYYSVLLLIVDSLHAHIGWTETITAVGVPAGLLDVLVAVPVSELLRRLSLWPNAPLLQVTEAR